MKEALGDSLFEANPFPKMQNEILSQNELPEEFEAAIPEIDSSLQEKVVKNLLAAIVGVEAVGVARGSVWLSFHPDVVSREVICQTLHDAGFSTELSLKNGKEISC